MFHRYLSTKYGMYLGILVISFKRPHSTVGGRALMNSPNEIHFNPFLCYKFQIQVICQ